MGPVVAGPGGQVILVRGTVHSGHRRSGGTDLRGWPMSKASFISR